MDKLVGFARKKRLGDLLVDAGVISQDQLVKALQVQKTEKQGERLGVVLIDLGFTDEKQIVDALKAQYRVSICRPCASRRKSSGFWTRQCCGSII